MRDGLSPSDRLGLIRPESDAHGLGIASMAGLLSDCGIQAVVAGPEERAALSRIEDGEAGRRLKQWIQGRGLTALGFSYRLDPAEGCEAFGRLAAFLKRASLLSADSGPLRALFFAGLPRACELARERFPFVDGFFRGDEGPGECLDILGIPRFRLPAAAALPIAYDESRLAFGRELVASGAYRDIEPPDRSGSLMFGQRGDSLVARLDHGRRLGLPPLLRAHAGPYLSDRKEAVELFLSWCRELAAAGFLDVLSIGSSQLSQSEFGRDWSGLPNGGGVPINSPEEYERVWKAARPMLVRTYSGTRDVPALARMHEERIDIAWHALSLWWFSALDGRGPNPVRENLRQHLEAIRYAASTDKPVELNVPHHFAFRGGDDLSYVVSGAVAVRAAKLRGARTVVVQAMLGTPKATWGVQDLAKARALLALCRELEGPAFRVVFQARAGLDSFSPDPERAKAQLAAATALMDDVEPEDSRSPEIIHVVSFSEAVGLADPATIDESLRISLHALAEYRRLKASGAIGLGRGEAECRERERALLSGARAVLACMEECLADTYSERGLYGMLKAGFFPLPGLTELREEFPEALRWSTRFLDGGVRAVDGSGREVPLSLRLEAARAAAAEEA